MSPSVPTLELIAGLSMSRVLTGLWQVADQERDGRRLDPEQAASAMEAYVDAGLTSFDMADHYGSAEEIAGHYVDRQGSKQAQLFTKWVPRPGPITERDVRQAVDRACRRLRVEAIDLLQFHAWNYADAGWLDALGWLTDLQRAGRIRALGLTNFDTAHLRVALASGIPVVSNQLCFSLLDRRPAAAMTRLCLERGVKLLAYGTLAGGLLTERWLARPVPEPGGPATWSELKYRRFVEVAGGWERLQDLLDVLARIARRRGVSIANVASRYVLEQAAVGGIIIGARLGESQHIADTLRLFSFELQALDRKELEEAAALLSPPPGDCGDEYRRAPYLTAAGDLRDHLDSLPAPFPVQLGVDGRLRAASGTEWETLAGFSRAVRSGRRILVSGTTATHRGRVVGGADPAAQAHFVLDKIEGALQSLGGRLSDVVRTRVFVRHLRDWEVVARAHGERLAEARPANTLVQGELVGDDYLVEMEAEAELPEGRP